MTGFIKNIEDITLKNDTFRTVLYTGQHSQLVVMSLLPGEDIGMEVHPVVDQFIRIERGEGTAIMNGEEHHLTDGTAIVVPAGTMHNIVNTSAKTMKLYTVYSPPHHKDGTVHANKGTAESDHEDHI